MAAVFNIVPFVGATLAAILAILSALNESPARAALALAAMVVAQTVEGKLLAPHFVGRATGLHPLAVLLALLAGAHMAGLIGALVAVPFLAGVVGDRPRAVRGAPPPRLGPRPHGEATAVVHRHGRPVGGQGPDDRMAAVPASNVVLVGFMGAGKSVCGRLLARRLGRCFVETDDMIVSRDGRPIPEIFRADGEEAFRRLEAEALVALALKSGDVIATGGGLPCREGRMESLRELGTVVWLRGDLEELLARARRSGARPMLSGRTPSRDRGAASDPRALLRPRPPHHRYRWPWGRPGRGPPRCRPAGA